MILLTRTYSTTPKHRDSTVLIDADTRASFNFDPDYVNGGYGMHGWYANFNGKLYRTGV